MSNKEIARHFDLLAKLMELHEENPFKIRSYANAYLSLRKLEGDLKSMKKEEIDNIPGIGDAITAKIGELIETGKMKTLEKYKNMTPEGIQEMLQVRGLGPKKVRQLWKELGITSIGDLLYACNENRLVEVKGFGVKTQDEIHKKIEFFMGARGKYLFAVVDNPAQNLVSVLKNTFPKESFEITGSLRRKMPEVQGIEIISTSDIESLAGKIQGLDFDEEAGKWMYNELPVIWNHVDAPDFVIQHFKSSCSEEFLNAFGKLPEHPKREEEIFEDSNMQFIPPEYREKEESILKARNFNITELIEVSDIRGILHNHSTYSDGLHSLKDMADYVKQCGYEYFLISDHSRSASYAQGLEIERVLMQFREIEKLNADYVDFRIFKGIESDILNDGSLDYPDDILKQFEVVIASIHSNLNMEMDKATNRLIKAVENPYTRILGHPTGRLLLAREGYPVDHRKIIDACAANHVVIELNANPQRLDMDWKWIDYAVDKGVKIAINPDAHSKESIHYIQYGVYAARKAGLPADMCLNTMTKTEFEAWQRSGK